VTEKEVMKEVNKIFGKVPRGKKTGKLKVKEIQRNPEALVKFQKNRSNTFCFRCYAVMV
jgi:predicted Zn-dependent peptidase